MTTIPIRHTVPGRPRLYIDQWGEYWARPWIMKRRTWRKIKSTTEKEAQRELDRADWHPKAEKFPKLAERYFKEGCPNKRLERRPREFCDLENIRLTHLKEYFAPFTADEIKMPLVIRYRTWRVRRVDREGASGDRTVDLDLVTLSNVLNYAVSSGAAQFNYIRAGRPKFRQGADVKHSRERAPADADEIHKILGIMFANPYYQVSGWMAAFAYLTGCRTSELLRLRLDGDEAGRIDGNHLFLGRRSKRGINPFVLIGPVLKDCIHHFRIWHKERYPDNPYYFPGHGNGPADATSFHRNLRRACNALGLPHRAPHGFRSFYVTKRRSDGASDAQVAAEIGDRTVTLIHQTYGSLPANWTGGKKLSWKPKTGKLAWQKMPQKIYLVQKSGLKRSNPSNVKLTKAA